MSTTTTRANDSSAPHYATYNQNGMDRSAAPPDTHNRDGMNRNSIKRKQVHSWKDHGGNPHANVNTDKALPPFDGYLQPGLYPPPKKDMANPAPLGLFAFAFMTFLLALLNFHTKHILEQNIIVGPAFAYGGLMQLLAGMWEMAFGNTFGATALTSYAGFWLSLGIFLTPGFGVVDAYAADPAEFNYAFGIFLIGWFILSLILWVLTLRSTVALCAMFFTVWITLLCLAISYLLTPDVTGGTQNNAAQKAGGLFGLIAAFLAWYIGIAGLADGSNSFFVLPVWHFPWSEKGREERKKAEKVSYA